MKKSLFILISGLWLAVIISVPAFSAVTYRVKPGDNLWTVAKKYHISVDKLKTINSLNNHDLKLGQKLVLKQDHMQKAKGSAKNRGQRSASQAVISEEAEDDGEFIEYKVKRGDTVEKVAQKFGIEKDDIVESNSNLDRRLSPGKVLLIPRTTELETGEEVVDLSMKTLKPLKPWKTHEEKYMLVKVAKSFMGTPYRYGGNSVRGLDCSAFVKKIYDIFDVQLPRSAREQYETGSKISQDELAPGDLVFFKTKRFVKYPTHVGIYIGEGNFIHSSSGHARIGVKIDSLQTNFYNKAYIGATRVKKSPEENSETMNDREILTNIFSS
ncbi:MAG: C40 family peptidase [Syntrophobacterales bacterium]|nr:C40 family peptidase [Syntrophobacterales bacterium]